LARRRVVVTGLGIISPVGIGIPEAWGSIVAGKSGITRITRFDAAKFPSQIAGEVKGFEVAKWLAPKEARRFDTSKSFTSPAIRDGNPSVSNRVILVIPDTPATMFAHAAGTPRPTGETMPRPVTTTRRRDMVGRD